MRFFLILALLLSAGCGWKRFSVVEPVSPQEASVIRSRLSSKGDVSRSSLQKITSGAAKSDCGSLTSRLREMGWKYGTVEVSESKSSDRKLNIFYYTNLGLEKSNLPLTVIVNGGYVESHVTFENLKDAIERAKAPVLFFDQRGTGCSGLFPQEDRRVLNYGSDMIASDLQVILDSLEYKKEVRIFGHSSGGQVALRSLEMFENMDQKIITYGTSLLLDQEKWIQGRRAKQIARSQEFFKRYQDLKPRIEKLNSQISARDCFTDGKLDVCGPEVLNAGFLLVSEREHWPALAKWILALSPDGDQLDRKALTEFVRYFVYGSLVSDRRLAELLFQYEYGVSFRELCIQHTKQTDPSSFNECDLARNVTYRETSRAASKPIDFSRLYANLMTQQGILNMAVGEDDIFTPSEVLIQDGRTLSLDIKSLPDRTHFDQKIIADLIFQSTP